MFLKMSMENMANEIIFKSRMHRVWTDMVGYAV